MSDIKLVSPMLDNFIIGDPISDHCGIRCCPAMQKDSDEKYIVKIISVPASQVQYDALLLTGICADRDSALSYFNNLAEGIVDEINTLQKLSELEGFLSVEDYQVVPMEDEVGFDIYLLTKYKRTLTKQFTKQPMTHLSAINLGIDLCAALSVCRKLGYIYANLKPNNIYLSGEQGYRIGDIGFIKLDSLKYASLPEAYHSEYTAPEITDAYSTLNETIDIYALGLILYQIYNGGALPVANEETGAFAAPAFADEEMSEILLKACAENIDDRWADPIEMGQALVSYMQRNGANDIPIAQEVAAESTEETIEPEAVPEISEDIAEAMLNEQEVANYTEDELGNLTFLAESQDELTPNEEDIQIEYEEASEILAAADELIAHPTPIPVTEAEGAERSVPDADEPEAETVANEELVDSEPSDQAEESTEDEAPETAESTEDAPVEIAEEETSVENAEEESTAEESCEEDTTDNQENTQNNGENVTVDEEPVEETPEPKKKKSAWWKWLLVGLLIAGIGVAGYFYCTMYYLQPVSMELDGYDNKLTVSVDCAIDDLYVVCNDAYGNQHKELVVDGKAEFDDLDGNTAYTVTVGTNQFCKLTGDTTASYRTGMQTKIVSFTATNGAESGTVILNFVVDGTDSEQWRLTYTQTDGTEETITFSGHTVTLNNLNIGSVYTFKLEPVTNLFFDFDNEITFTPANPVQAENLIVSSYAEDSLTVTWNAPEGASVAKWIVRCFDGTTYMDPIETAELTATFTGIDSENTYVIEVLAENMSQVTKITAAEGVLSLSNFSMTQNSGMLKLSWDASADVEASGWIVSYAIADSAATDLRVISGNECDTIPYFPNVNYTISVKAADGRETINNQYSFKSDSAPKFKNYGVGAEHIHFDMCKTPSKTNWTVRDLVSSDFTTTFSASEKASFLLSIPYAYDEPNDAIVVSYTIYNEDGEYVIGAVENGIWGEMWDRGYCELDIPSIPSVAGNYRIAICFNGAVVNESNFAITA